MAWWWASVDVQKSNIVNWEINAILLHFWCRRGRENWRVRTKRSRQLFLRKRHNRQCWEFLSLLKCLPHNYNYYPHHPGLVPDPSSALSVKSNHSHFMMWHCCLWQCSKHTKTSFLDVCSQPFTFFQPSLLICSSLLQWGRTAGEVQPLDLPSVPLHCFSPFIPLLCFPIFHSSHANA